MQKPGFLKRLLVVTYDGILLSAVLFFSSAVLMAVAFVIFKSTAPELFFIDSEAIANEKITTLSSTGRLIGNIIVSINCVLLSFFFFGWFWTHGGQTLGMKAWNLYLINPDGRFIDWRTAMIRYCSAVLSWSVFGLGFSWILLNQRKLAWHDIISNTQLIYKVAEKK